MHEFREDGKKSIFLEYKCEGIMMGNCMFLGTSLILLLSGFCLWNCYNQQLRTHHNQWFGCKDEQGQLVDS